MWSEVLVSHSCLTLCSPMDCSPSGSSVHGIFQARILGWVAISFSWGSSPPRDWTRVFCTAGRFFTDWATREAHVYIYVCTYALCTRCPLSAHLFQHACGKDFPVPLALLCDLDWRSLIYVWLLLLVYFGCDLETVCPSQLMMTFTHPWHKEVITVFPSPLVCPRGPRRRSLTSPTCSACPTQWCGSSRSGPSRTSTSWSVGCCSPVWSCSSWCSTWPEPARPRGWMPVPGRESVCECVCAKERGPRGCPLKCVCPS